MAEAKNELSKQVKKEIKPAEEHTVPGIKYLPSTDIVETADKLFVYMDMPGVDRDNVNVRLEKNVLTVEGAVESKPYADLKPLYSEYNIGHFSRSFDVSNKIDHSGIEAKIENGVLILTLPKTPEEKPMSIKVN